MTVKVKLIKDKILSNLPRVFIEAGSSDTWYKYSGETDLIFGVNLFGESGKGNDVYAHFGLEDKQILKIMQKFFNDNLKKKFSDSFNFLYNKKALVRIDLNVPIANGKIEDDTRIKKILPTLKILLKKSFNNSHNTSRKTKWRMG